MCDGGTAMATALEDEIISPTNFVLVTSHECSYTFKGLSLSLSLAMLLAPFSLSLLDYGLLFRHSAFVTAPSFLA
jgi:hypothetical protein